MRGFLRRISLSGNSWIPGPDSSVKRSAAMAKNISGVKIWYRVIKGLNKARLDYVLVGAAALAIHGIPRSTLDLDIYVPARTDVINKLFKVSACPIDLSDLNLIKEIMKYKKKT